MVMHSSELRAWGVAFSASILLHVAIIGYYDQYHKSLIGGPSKIRLATIYISLERVELKQSKTRNAAHQKQELFEAAKSENISPKQKQPEPAIADVNKPEVEQHEPFSEEISQLKVMPTAPISSLTSDDLKNEYIRLLMADIEAHKYYPRRARKRGIEGIVKISFELLNNGDITNVLVSGGHRILRAAAKHAIDQTLPLQIPPPYMQLPLEIHFSMRFKFK